MQYFPAAYNISFNAFRCCVKTRRLRDQTGLACVDHEGLRDYPDQKVTKATQLLVCVVKREDEDIPAVMEVSEIPNSFICKSCAPQLLV